MLSQGSSPSSLPGWYTSPSGHSFREDLPEHDTNEDDDVIDDVDETDLHDTPSTCHTALDQETLLMVPDTPVYLRTPETVSGTSLTSPFRSW